VATIGNDANEEIELCNFEHKVILPSSFVGSPCNIFEIFLDSMAIICYFKQFDLFGIMIVTLIGLRSNLHYY
jgi:hypothetical protein